MLMSLCHGFGAAIRGKRVVGSDSLVGRIGQWKFHKRGILEAAGYAKGLRMPGEISLELLSS